MSDVPPTEPPTATPSATGHSPRGGGLALAFGALGIVFGDIGTSPLYALKECVSKGHGVDPTPDNVLGILSLIFWALTLVVTLKYLLVVMRADNQGEGGILALLALTPDRFRVGRPGRVTLIVVLAIAGAALLYGDGMITPAISVLSAVEGLKEVTPDVAPYVVPIAIAILVGLFAIQRHGTARIGRLFGPIMLLWFVVIAVLGLIQIVQHPEVLAALSPHHAIRFFSEHGLHAFLLLGSVVLVVTGGEALYADMGHFGRRPIRMAWLAVVKPALLLAYFGQGALLLAHPEARSNLFFKLVDNKALTVALVILATMATIIASQALISGVYSLTRQAMQLGLLPRFEIRHTSVDTEGQIYLPGINKMLAVACIALVAIFQASEALASAYGIAVAGTMAITSVLFYLVARERQKWSRSLAIPLVGLFLLIDLAFLAANGHKVVSGGWVPIAIGVGIAFVMITWRIGRSLWTNFVRQNSPDFPAFKASLGGVARTPGTFVFLASAQSGVPIPLVRQVKFNRALAENVIVLTLEFESVPYCAAERGLEIDDVGAGIHCARAHVGYMESPDATQVIDAVMTRLGLATPRNEVVYVLGRETAIVTGKRDMRGLPESVFGYMQRNALPASNYFNIPAEQVVEFGMQIDL